MKNVLFTSGNVVKSWALVTCLCLGPTHVAVSRDQDLRGSGLKRESGWSTPEANVAGRSVSCGPALPWAMAVAGVCVGAVHGLHSRPSTPNPDAGLFLGERPPDSQAALEGGLSGWRVAVGAGDRPQVPGAWPGVSHGAFILPLMVF